MNRNFLLIFACIGFFAINPIGATQTDEPDHVVTGWYLGMPVLVRAYEILSQQQMAAGEVVHGHEQMVTYVTAPISRGIGISPQRVLTTPAGEITLPAHQAVITKMNSPDQPMLGNGYFVVPGPEANQDSVRTAPKPENSWAKAPLAREIRIGPDWVLLNSHLVIEYGLKKGLLDLVFFSGGALMWATLDWEDYEYQPDYRLVCHSSFAPSDLPQPEVP